ncbi:MAG: hypothetical protein GX617_07265 [Lentisphaerae bacterium]|nr:hypothetical protein [Lentisphaerota bacterium]
MFTRTFATLSTIFVSITIAAQPDWTLALNRSTGGTVKYRDQQIISFTPGLFYPGWTGTSINGFDSSRLEDSALHGKTTHNNVTFTSDLALATISDNTQLLSYQLATQQDVVLNSFYVGFNFPASVLLGHNYQIDNQPAKAFPAALDQTRIESGPVTRIAVETTGGTVVFSFRQPTNILLQDNRQWSDSFVIRVGNDSNDSPWKAGDSIAFDLELQFPAPFTLNRPELTVITAGEDWIPLDTVLGIKPDSALDFSAMSYFDAPAGKHGWVKAVGKHFEFANLPGKAQRFYGINFCGNGQVNPHEQAAELAERLQRLGYNTVRFHHHENSLIDRSNGQSTKLNPDAMDKLDFFFAELKKRGMYSTTDMYVSRRVYAGEIWPGATGDLDMREFKYLVPVCPAAMANWKEFSRNFLLHKNPYTGLTYAEDPAMAWLSMINEGTLSVSAISARDDRVKALWLDAWNAWLTKKYGSSSARNQAWELDLPEALTEMLPKDASDAAVRDVNIFFLDTQNAMFAEMKAFLRDELGCQALLTDMNFGGNAAWMQLARNNFDYVDDHFYIDHPSFLEKRWSLPSRCPNQSVVARGSIGGDHNSFTRLLDKPFTITEYNYSGPGRYRGVGGILTGCLGAIQDWAGIWRFAYAHGNSAIFKPSITNYFDMVRDPLNQAAERATLCLYLRQDMLPAAKTIAITMHPEHLSEHPSRPEGGLAPAWRTLNAHAQVGAFIANPNTPVPADVSMALSSKAPQAKKNIAGDVLGQDGKTALSNWLREDKWLPEGNLTDLDASPSPRQSPNKQLTIVPAEDTMILDTARTAGAYAPAGATINTEAARITILDTDATVWASSLDDSPLATSPHILVTHLTDLQNTDASFAEKERQTLLSWGKLPHLVRNGRAKVLIRSTRPGTPKAWVLRTDGERVATLPVTKTTEGIELDLAVKGQNGAQFIYELLWE